MKAIAGISFLVFLLIVSCTHKQTVSPGPLKPVKEVPAFSGVNFDGRTITEKDVRGKVWIAYFMFTSCGTVCPKMSSQASVLHYENKDNHNVEFVSFTVDPRTDTKEVLAKYAERYGAATGGWYFVRMSKDSVNELSAKGFRIGNINEPVMHSTRFVLVDKKGWIRGYFDGTDPNDVEKLRAATTQLLAE